VPISTPTPEIPLGASCSAITDFAVSNRTGGDNQLELSWRGGDSNVVVWIDGGNGVISVSVNNVGYYEAKNLDNNIGYWFWITNDCSQTIKIDPLP
jgi:hypothetical protein